MVRMRAVVIFDGSEEDREVLDEGEFTKGPLGYMPLQILSEWMD